MNSQISEDLPKSRRPKETKFKQQKLPAWQPIMTAGTVLPAFIAIGIVFIPLGVTLLVTSNSVQEFVIDYTTDNCKPLYLNLTQYPTCAAYIQQYVRETCYCQVNFTLERAFLGSVYMYYGLTNFYQNHRRYVRSRDDEQLLGMSKPYTSSLNADCEPYRGNGTSPYAPCGAIANSLFSDVLTLAYKNGSSLINVSLLNTGIAWSTDVNDKFKNPDTFNGTSKPEYWSKPVYELDPSNEKNNGYLNEDLIVWMRTAALPNFRKFYRRVNHTVAEFSTGLPAGNYVLNVSYTYPVINFDGRKQMILTTTSWLGGKNPFLGIAYIVVGCISICLGLVFLVIHWKVGKRPLEIIQDVNRRTAY